MKSETIESPLKTGYAGVTISTGKSEPITNNEEITLTDNVANYKWLTFIFYSGNVASSTRGKLTILRQEGASAAYYPISFGGSVGFVRLEISGTKFTFLSSSESTLYFGGINAYK